MGRGDFGTLLIDRRPSNSSGEGLPDSTRAEDNPNQYGLIKTVRLLTPIVIGNNNGWTLIENDVVAAPLTQISNIPFAPLSLQVINFSDQDCRLVYRGQNVFDALDRFDFECPSRFYATDAVDPVENNPDGIIIAISGFANPRPRLITLRFFSRPQGNYSLGALPPDIGVNALETYEKSTTISGTTLAVGATDPISLNHASSSIQVAADGATMQFRTGPNAANLSNAFTLYAGEKASLGVRIGYIEVKNIDTVVGGYRIWDAYASETL